METICYDCNQKAKDWHWQWGECNTIYYEKYLAQKSSGFATDYYLAIGFFLGIIGLIVLLVSFLFVG